MERGGGDICMQAASANKKDTDCEIFVFDKEGLNGVTPASSCPISYPVRGGHRSLRDRKYLPKIERTVLPTHRSDIQNCVISCWSVLNLVPMRCREAS